MNLIFVHGWSVTNTSTYGDLPASLASKSAAFGLDLNIQHLYLGKYVSFHDEVTVDDITRGLDRALRELPGNGDRIQPFSCITHSTGGPVVRHWIDRYFGPEGLADLPLQHLVMLAPANHGSSLAKIGKARVGRIKAFFGGVEPGQRVLDWLALGSEEQWQLNRRYIDYETASQGFFPFVLTGQGIDTKFYDFLNSYLVEAGSDGVVRIAGANLNYRYLALSQTDIPIKRGTYALQGDPAQPVRRATGTPLGVFHQFSHSGTKMGILASSRTSPSHDLICEEILKCLRVGSEPDFSRRRQELATLTATEQALTPVGKESPISRYCMLVIRIHDERGETIKQGDFDLLLLAGSEYSPTRLPKGFRIDSQFNDTANSLVYYLDYERMKTLKNGCFGLRVIVRPEKGFAYYQAGEFRSDGLPIDDVFAPNETTYVDITMQRRVDKSVFRFDRADRPSGSFKGIKPSGEPA